MFYEAHIFFILAITDKMPKFADKMKTSVIIRFVVLGFLWLILVGVILVRTPQINFYTIFVIIASAIIIFVPIYKKYVKNGDDR